MMKKLSAVLLAAVFVVGLTAGAARAADKFGYVDLSRTFSEYNKTKKYDKILNDKEQKYSAEREKKIKDLKQFEDKMNLLSDKKKAAKQGERDKKISDLHEFDRSRQADLRKEQDERMKEVLKDIEDAVKDYSRKQGYTMVFNDRVLVYQDKKLDITDKIIQILNKK